VLCAAQAGPVTYFIVKALFDAYWLAQIVPSNTIRKEIFVADFGLIEGSIPPEDPEGIQVYYLPPDIWDDINAYLDEHGTACEERCILGRYVG